MTHETIEYTKREQVALQCKVVARLAENIAHVYNDLAFMYARDDGSGDAILDIKGKNGARLMETLGDILNNMDAVSDEDSWMDDVFVRAQKMFGPDLTTAPMDAND